jgi:hypothetical protein
MFLPRYADQLSYAGTAIVFVAAVAVLRQRRSRSKRRGAVQQQLMSGAEA